MAFIDQGEFEAIKSLSGWKAARSDEHQFCAKIKVSTLAVYELSSFDKWSGQRRKNTKNGTFATAHFCVLLSSAWLLGSYMSLADQRRHSNRKPGRLNNRLPII